MLHFRWGIEVPKIAVISFALLSLFVSSAWTDNQDDCEAWCFGEGREDCLHCDNRRNCGLNNYNIRAFDTHDSEPYYACGLRDWDMASDRNRSMCEAYCREQSHCAFCSTEPNCGNNYERMLKFGGYGDNYYACRKAVSVNAGWPFRASPQPKHNVLAIALSGSSAGGLEWFCEENAQRLDENVLCISSYANSSTRSELLANHISSMIDLMRMTSGQQPIVVLIGKSMGGCKIHHAVSGVRDAEDSRLQNYEIDLFVSVDMSCGYDRHWEEGSGDALTFAGNIRNLVIFYQQIGPMQTGHRAYRYPGAPFEPDIHIDVNADGFDLDNERRIPNSLATEAMCVGADHGSIDDCASVQDALVDLINKRAQQCKCCKRVCW